MAFIPDPSPDEQARLATHDKKVSSFKADPTPPNVSQAGSLGYGAAQGATLGFGDEIQGAIQAALPRPGVDFNPLTYFKEMGKRYDQERDWARKKNTEAQEANPGTYLVGQVVGGLAPGVLTGTGLGAMAGTGAAQGVGYSNADSATGLAGDAALGAGIGTAGWGAGKLLSKAAGALARKATGKLDKIAPAVLAAEAATEAHAPVASAKGAYASGIQKGSRQVENIMRLEPVANATEQAAIRALETSGATPGLQHQVLGSTIQALPGQVAENAALKATYDAARAAEASEAARLLAEKMPKGTAAFLKEALKNAVSSGAEGGGEGLVRGAFRETARHGVPLMVTMRTGSPLLGALTYGAGWAGTRALRGLGEAAATNTGQRAIWEPTKKAAEAVGRYGAPALRRLPLAIQALAATANESGGQ